MSKTTGYFACTQTAQWTPSHTVEPIDKLITQMSILASLITGDITPNHSTALHLLIDQGPLIARR